MWVNTGQCTGLWVVRNIPKFKGRANWSRYTVQPMRRRALFIKISTQWSKIFTTAYGSRTNFKISLQYSSSYHIISKKRIRVLFIARNHWGVRTNSGPVADRYRGRGSSTDLACKIFDRSKLVMCKNYSRRECVKICWDLTKQEWYFLLTSTGQESKNQSS